MVKTVRIDIVVPKLEDGEDAQFLAEQYQDKMATKAENERVRKEQKAKNH